jgi:tripartite ATP-independent transporter DctP family solute receptor
MVSIRRISVIIIVILCTITISHVAYAEKYKVKVATIAPTDTPWHTGFLTVKKNVEQRTNGNVKLLLFMGGQLGAEIETLEGAQLGTIHMWAGSTGAIENLIPDFGVFDLPFLWDSTEELYYVLDNVVKEPLFNKFEDIGLKAVAWSENGWRHFANKKNSIYTPEDLQKIKWRSQESEVHLAMWKALEATAVPVNMTEVFSALQTNMVEGADNSLLILSATGWWETMKYLTISQHIYQPGVLAFNINYWKKLPEEYQKILVEEFTNSANFARTELAKFEPEMIEVFKSMGYEVNTLTLEERTLFVEKTKMVHEQFAEKFSDILPLIEKGKQEFREKK